MASSLQSQLQQIATGKTAKTALSHKGRASFLYEAKEAALYDSASILQVGQEGLAELAKLDARFADYATTIFSDASLHYDRAVKSGKENEQLNKDISSFLILLSPYFLVQPASSVLEWLIRRYRIHDFNVEAVLRCIWPYFEHDRFKRMVQILAVSDNIHAADWGFLAVLKNTDSKITRHTFVQEMIRNHHLFDFVCTSTKMAVKAGTAFPTLFSAYLAVMIMYTERINITEQRLNAFMPHIMAGLRTRAYEEMQLASYLILIAVSSKCFIKADTCDMLVTMICDAASANRSREALMCIAMVVNTQPETSSLAKSTFKRVLKIPGLDDAAKQLEAVKSCQKFISILVMQLCPMITDEPATFCTRVCLLLENLDGHVMPLIAQDAISAAVAAFDNNENRSQVTKQFIDWCKTHYPYELSQSLTRMINAKGADAEVATDAPFWKDIASEYVTEQAENVMQVDAVASVRESDAYRALSALFAQRESEAVLLSRVMAMVARAESKAVWFAASQLTADAECEKDAVFRIIDRMIACGGNLVETITDAYNDASARLFIAYAIESRDLKSIIAALDGVAAIMTGKDVIDYQNIIPAILSIQHATTYPDVRAKTIQLLGAIKERYDAHMEKATAAAGKPKKKQSRENAMTIYGVSDFYGEATSAVMYLLPAAAQALCEYFVLAETEAISGNNYCSELINAFLASLRLKPKTEGAFAIIGWLTSHAASMPVGSGLAGIIGLLQDIAQPLYKLRCAISLMDTPPRHVGNAQDRRVTQTLAAVNRYTAQLFTADATEYLNSPQGEGVFERFCNILSALRTCSSADSLPHACLAQLEEAGLYTKLAQPRQAEIFKMLLTMAFDTRDEALAHVRGLLSRVPLDGKVLAGELNKACAELANACQMRDSACAGAKRRRMSIGHETAAEQTRETENASDDVDARLAHITGIFEVLDSNTAEWTNVQNVVPTIFAFASLLLDIKSNVKAAVDYSTQIVLAVLDRCIAHCYTNNIELSARTLRVQVIVDTIRSSSNPQTHAVSLTVLSTISRIDAGNVLANAMPIFTFMEANILRQDDAYSVSVVRAMLRAILPPLVEQLRADGGAEQYVVQSLPIIKIFVDALLHIPPHRRSTLFELLLSLFGAGDTLHAFVSLILERYCRVVYSPGMSTSQLNTESQAEYAVDFCLKLLGECNVYDALDALSRLAQVVVRLGQHSAVKDANGEDFNSSDIYSPADHSTEDVAVYKANIYMFISRALLRDDIHGKLKALMVDETSDARLERGFTDLTQSLLASMLLLKSARDETVLAAATSALVTVSKRVSMAMLLAIFRELFQQECPMLRRKAIDSLVARLGQMKQDDAARELEKLGSFVELLISIVANESETSDNIQAALGGLARLVRLAGKANASLYASTIMEVVMSERAVLHSDENIAAAGLHYVSTACIELGPRVVPVLPKLVPFAMSKLEAISAAELVECSAEKPFAMSRIQHASLKTLETVIERLAQFASAYVERILSWTITPALQTTVLSASTRSNGGKKHLVAAGSEIQKMLIAHANARILVPAAINIWSSEVSNADRKTASGRCLVLSKFVCECMAGTTRAQVAGLVDVVSRFLLTALDIRHAFPAAMHVTCLQAEQNLYRVLQHLAVNVNESTFKPIFLALFAWATKHASADRATGRAEIFYSAFGLLLESFKVIIILVLCMTVHLRSY